MRRNELLLSAGVCGKLGNKDRDHVEPAVDDAPCGLSHSYGPKAGAIWAFVYVPGCFRLTRIDVELESATTLIMVSPPKDLFCSAVILYVIVIL